VSTILYVDDHHAFHGYVSKLKLANHMPLESRGCPVTGSKVTCVAGVMTHGAVAGVAGTLLITLAARMIPWLKRAKASRPAPDRLPSDPFQTEEVIKWQDRSRSPAAYSSPERNLGSIGRTAVEEAASVTPAGALAEVQAPGPEGAAELFFVKMGSGLFDKDVSRYARPAGKAVHCAYGTLGGVLYGLVQSRRIRDPWLCGVFHGLFMWGIGPAWLVPAMHLIAAPTRLPKRQTALMIGGHVMYGITVAKVFAALERGKK
jgi:hypothetical protein